jgi:beta-phosphoglucomutase-like phosphatase (HAD superfamily)
MVVFDMAGTTVDENNVVYKTLQKAINEREFNFSLEQVLAEGAGKEKFQAVKSILGTYAGINDDTIAKPIFERFLVLLEEAYNNLHVLPQPNALEVFHALKKRGIIVILNTGYNNKSAVSLVEKFGWV